MNRDLCLSCIASLAYHCENHACPHDHSSDLIASWLFRPRFSKDHPRLSGNGGQIILVLACGAVVCAPRLPLQCHLDLVLWAIARRMLSFVFPHDLEHLGFRFHFFSLHTSKHAHNMYYIIARLCHRYTVYALSTLIPRSSKKSMILSTCHRTTYHESKRVEIPGLSVTRRRSDESQHLAYSKHCLSGVWTRPSTGHVTGQNAGGSFPEPSIQLSGMKLSEVPGRNVVEKWLCHGEKRILMYRDVVIAAS